MQTIYQMNIGIICCSLNESVLHICFISKIFNWTFKSLIFTLLVKFQLFQKLSHIWLIYLKRKIISCRIEIHEEKTWFVMEKIDKKWKNTFFALKSGQLGIFDAQFSKIFHSKPKIWFQLKLLGASTWKTINSWKFFLYSQKRWHEIYSRAGWKDPAPGLIGVKER